MTRSQLEGVLSQTPFDGHSDKNLKAMLEQIQRKITPIYDPKTAFGNMELIALETSGAWIRQVLKETVECGQCKGNGYIEHECDCERCDYEGDNCDACTYGRNPKNI